MAKKDTPDTNPLDSYVEGTERLMTGFTVKAAAFAPSEVNPTVLFIGRVIVRAMKTLRSTIAKAFESAGVAADDIQEVLDSFGAGTLIEEINERLDAATTPADLAAIGTLLPIVKKIIRFTVDIFKIQLPADLDKILELIDELATTAVDFISPKGAEAMHRSEVRFLEAQFHLDRLGSLKDQPVDGNGR